MQFNLKGLTKLTGRSMTGVSWVASTAHHRPSGRGGRSATHAWNCKHMSIADNYHWERKPVP